MNAVAELIKKQNFKEANELIQNIGLVKFMDGLLEKAYDDESINNYTFVNGWLIEEETYDKHILAINLLFHPLCHIEGAYQSSLYHVKRCMNLSESNDLISLENLLFLNEVPEKVVSDEEAKKVALEILRIDPDHEIAKKYIGNN